MNTKEIDINFLLQIKKIDERTKKEIAFNYKYNTNIPARIRFKDVKFYNEYQHIPVSVLCKAFNVSRSAYYDYLKREKSNKPNKDVKIINAIREIQEHYDYVYGVNKIRIELIRNYSSILRKGNISRNKVYRLMKINGLLSRCVCNKRNKAIYNNHNATYSNLIGISSPTKNMFQRLGTDVLERRTSDGKLYLSIVQEQCCDGILGFVITRSMSYDIVGKTVDQALAFVPGTKNMIIHSDRGSLYKTKRYRQMCKQHNLKQSMSRPATPEDNGQTESFFSCLTREKLLRINITSYKQLAREIEDYIYFYNYVRINARLGMPPMEYYNLHKNNPELIANLKDENYSNFSHLIEIGA